MRFINLLLACAAVTTASPILAGPAADFQRITRTTTAAPAATTTSAVVSSTSKLRGSSSAIVSSSSVEATSTVKVSSSSIKASRTASNAASSTVSITTSTGSPLPPSEDPWYEAPAGYTTASPGTVFAIRTAPGNLVSMTDGAASAAYNIKYATEDSQNASSWAVTTLFVPASPYVSIGKSAFLSYQIPYDSNYINASPSYALYQGLDEDILDALVKGWYVSVPDYEGPLASFTAGQQSGHATLDSVRAVFNADLGLDIDETRYALWGYSGGALASEWAAELQLDYAPELGFSGAALGGLTPNVTSVIEVCTDTINAGLLPEGFLGLTTQWPEARAALNEYLNPTGRYDSAAFFAAENMTLGTAESTYAFQDIFKYFSIGESFLTLPAITNAINNDGIMGLHGVPQMPVYAYKAINDEISPVADTDALISKYCSLGANILYQRNTVGGHSAEETNGDDAAFEFLEAVLQGTYSLTYQTEGCTVANVTITTSTSPLRRKWRK